jgi:Fe-S-cluster-containing dehydrogenase component
VAISRRRFIRLGTHAAFGGLLVYTLRGVLPRSSLSTADAAGNAAYDRYRPEEHDWAFIVDTAKCIGCGRCARACKLENDVPWDPACNRTWVERYRFTQDGEVLVDSPNGGIDGFYSVGNREGDGEGAAVDYKNGLPDHIPLPASDKAGVGSRDIKKSFFVPKLCNQCDKPPCVQVCPVGATYKTVDGVVLVNWDTCIGCRYCIQACPYGALYLLPKKGVVDKCTWCYHRITKGQVPACVEACPVGARIFGDLRDPESEVNRILAEQRIYVLKPEMGTEPQVWYLDLDGAVR